MHARKFNLDDLDTDKLDSLRAVGMSRGLHICIAIVKELVELSFKSMCVRCLTLFIYICLDL